MMSLDVKVQNHAVLNIFPKNHIMLIKNDSAVFARTLFNIVLFLSLFALQMNSHASPEMERDALQDSYKVAVREVPPFSYQDSTGEWHGMSVELWQEIASRLELDFEFIDMPLDETISALRNNSIDVAIAAISVTADREEFLDFSHPYYLSGLASAYSTQNESAWLSTVKAFFSIQFFSAVGSLVAVLLIAGFFIWLFERKANAEEFGHGDMKRGLGDGFWWSAVTMTTVGYGDKSPKTLGGRIVALIWMFVSLIIIASFTASIAASLTTNQLVSSRFQDKALKDMKVAVLNESAAQEYVQNQGARTSNVDSIDEALQKLVTGEVDTIVHDEPILRYNARQSGFDVDVSDTVLVRDDYAFAYPEQGRLRDISNLALLSLLFSPEWEEIKNRYVGQ